MIVRGRVDCPRWSWVAPIFGVGLLLIVALRFAQPIADGDLFWHMAYGAQILERGTLQTDHSLYSWTPVSNDAVYCAWTGELLFAALWKTLGIGGVVGLRYASILAVLVLLGWYARRSGLIARPVAWLVLLVTLLASVVATFPKPELLSLVLWNGLVFCWFQTLLAAEAKKPVLPWIYTIPAVVLVWVNTHGGFILAAPFLALIAIAGRWMLPKREARHLWAAMALCAVATFLNPYGARYPLQLVRFAIEHSAERPDLAWNNAFQPTWSAAGRFYHLLEFLGWMTLGLVIACIGRPRGWLMMIALFLAYVPLELLYVRSTFLLPAIFGYGVLFLIRERVRRVWMDWAAVLLFFGFGARAVYETKFRPETDSWMGFGISYAQPVEEANFVAEGNFGPRLYNTYNVGGYLLWRLYPRYQVMVDGRSFPYARWFNELYQFTRTSDPNEFQGFLRRHRGDVAIVDFQEDAVWRSFLVTPDWRPAFYGPSSAVFVPTNGKRDPVIPAASLEHLANAATGVRIFRFARAVGDYKTAWKLLDQMQGPLRREVSADILEPLQAYREGHAALRAGRYQLAWDFFARSFQHEPIEGQDKTLLMLLRALTKTQEVDPHRADLIKAGLARLQAPE